MAARSCGPLVFGSSRHTPRSLLSTPARGIRREFITRRVGRREGVSDFVSRGWIPPTHPASDKMAVSDMSASRSNVWPAGGTADSLSAWPLKPATLVNECGYASGTDDVLGLGRTMAGRDTAVPDSCPRRRDHGPTQRRGESSRDCSQTAQPYGIAWRASERLAAHGIAWEAAALPLSYVREAWILAASPPTAFRSRRQLCASSAVPKRRIDARSQVAG